LMSRLIDSKRMCTKSFIVDWTHPALVRAVLQKKVLEKIFSYCLWRLWVTSLRHQEPNKYR